MARFDVYENPDASESNHTPYLLDVQNNFIDHLSTRAVIPLRTTAAFGVRARDLNPIVQVGDNSLVLDTAAIGVVPLNALRRPVADLRDARGTIHGALDTLFGSY